MASGSEHVQQNLKRLQLYEVTRTRGKELGRGSYAAVFEVMVQGTPCAAKEVHPILMSAKNKDSFYAECVRSSQLVHPNIVQFMGIHYPSPNAELPWLVMELMYISLTGLIEQQEKKREDIPFHFKMSILVDACQGLQFLHSKNIAHRDLSSNNILLTKHLVAKIADLGMAKVILGDSQKHTLAPGNQIFMPPEALAEDEVVYGIAIDVFSMGCVCLHVISMQWPTPKAMKLLDSKTGKVVALTELQRRETYLLKFQQFPALKELVCKCLHDFPKERPSITEVLEGLQTVHWDLAYHEKDDIIQLYNSVASYKRMLERMAEQLQQQRTQLTLTCEQLGEAKEQLTVKDAQLAESRQQIEELHSQLLVAAKENDSQVFHYFSLNIFICNDS